jgi:hypothetical protein
VPGQQGSEVALFVLDGDDDIYLGWLAHALSVRTRTGRSLPRTSR